MLLERYRRSGQIQLVNFGVSWERDHKVHLAAYRIGQQLGAEVHWQFWSDSRRDYELWWERKDIALKQLAKQSEWTGTPFSSVWTARLGHD